MNFLGKLQKQYEKLWKYIIRPTRSPYSEEQLGPSVFTIKGSQFHRKDFQLTNKRGYNFSCSLWLPVQSQEYPCVIYLHGNSSNRVEGTEYLRRLLSKNIALCTFDFSGSGNAQGQYVSLGYYQQKDLQQVINYLKNYPQINNIALWGRSMGAVTALLYLSSHKGIKAAVFDSPFKSLKALVDDTAQKITKIPKIMLNGAFKIISRTIQKKAQFSIYELDPLIKAVPFLNVPVFFMVGLEDQIIPIDHTKDLFQSYGGNDKVLKILPGSHNSKRPAQSIEEIVEFFLINFNQREVKIQTSEVWLKEEERGVAISSSIQVKILDQSNKNRQSNSTSIFDYQKGQKNLNNKIEKQCLSNVLQIRQKKQRIELIKMRQEQLQKMSDNKEMVVIGEPQLQDSMRQYTYCYI